MIETAICVTTTLCCFNLYNDARTNSTCLRSLHGIIGSFDFTISFFGVIYHRCYGAKIRTNAKNSNTQQLLPIRAPCQRLSRSHLHEVEVGSQHPSPSTTPRRASVTVETIWSSGGKGLHSVRSVPSPDRHPVPVVTTSWQNIFNNVWSSRKKRLAALSQYLITCLYSMFNIMKFF